MHVPCNQNMDAPPSATNDPVLDVLMQINCGVRLNLEKLDAIHATLRAILVNVNNAQHCERQAKEGINSNTDDDKNVRVARETNADGPVGGGSSSSSVSGTTSGVMGNDNKENVAAAATQQRQKLVRPWAKFASLTPATKKSASSKEDKPLEEHKSSSVSLSQMDKIDKAKETVTVGSRSPNKPQFWWQTTLHGAAQRETRKMQEANQKAQVKPLSLTSAAAAAPSPLNYSSLTFEDCPPISPEANAAAIEHDVSLKILTPNFIPSDRYKTEEALAHALGFPAEKRA